MLALAVLALVLQQTEPARPATPPAPPAAPSAPAAPRPPAPPRAPRAHAQAAAPERSAAEEPVLKGFEKRSGKRFSGTFDETDVDDALRRIADAGDWSIVLPRGKHGEISARFKNTPVEEALAAVLSQAGLVASREGTIITVRPRSGPAGEARAEADRETRRTERESRRRSRDRVVRGDVVVHAGKAERDVVALRGSIKVEPGGEVRDAVAILGSVTLEPGAHARQAVAVGGNVKLGPGATTERDAVSVGGDVQRDPSAEVGGNTVSVGIPAVAGLVGAGVLFAGHDHSPGLMVGQVLAKFLVYFALGLLVLALFPRRLEAVSASFTAQPLKSVLSGLLGVVLLPILIVLLIATVIGILLVPVAAFLAVAAGVLGFTALAYYVGRALPIRIERGTSVLQLALGTAIVVLVTAIPFLGSMAWIAALLLTFGAVLRSRFGSHGPPVLPTTTVPPPAPPPAPAT